MFQITMIRYLAHFTLALGVSSLSNGRVPISLPETLFNLEGSDDTSSKIADHNTVGMLASHLRPS